MAQNTRPWRSFTRGTSGPGVRATAGAVISSSAELHVRRARPSTSVLSGHVWSMSTAVGSGWNVRRKMDALVLWKCFDTAPSSSLAATSPAPEGGHRRRHHVVLCHGLGSNRFTFDLSRDVSVVDFLVAKGWTTWLVDLRGAKRQALSVLLIWYCIFSFRQALLTLESIARWR